MRPTLATAVLLGAGVPVAFIAVTAEPGLWAVAPAWLLAVALGVLADALGGPHRSRLAVDVTAPPLLYIGRTDTLAVDVALPGGPGTTVEIQLQSHGPLAPPGGLRLRGGGRAEVALAAERRGEVVIEALWLTWRGRLGLVRWVARVPVERRIAAVPDIHAVRALALRLSPRGGFHGTKAVELRGEGSEFESLREFAPGFDIKSIDWKHSARHRKLLSKEYAVERNHHVIVAFDCGRLMSEPFAGLTKLDHAVNGGLQLAFMALRTGDHVGLYAFDAEPRAFVEPTAGIGAMARLQAACGTLDYATAETNFTLGLARLMERLKRRSLIVLHTDFSDTVTSELMIDNLGRMAKRHLVVFATFEDPALASLATARPDTAGALAGAVIADDIRSERRLVLGRLRRMGIDSLDVAPGQMSAALIARYLDVKRRERL